MSYRKTGHGSYTRRQKLKATLEKKPKLHEGAGVKRGFIINGETVLLTKKEAAERFLVKEDRKPKSTEVLWDGGIHRVFHTTE